VLADASAKAGKPCVRWKLNKAFGFHP
jgi:hypothetical protein